MWWRNHWVRWDEVVGLPKVIRGDKYESQESGKYHHKPYYILDRIISVERNFFRISVYP